jgi:hypothetical protein
VTSRVTKYIEHRVNFGNYEGVTVRASIERDCDEGAEQKTLGKLADLLANALEDDLKEAAKFADSSSYVREWEG